MLVILHILTAVMNDGYPTVSMDNMPRNLHACSLITPLQEQYPFTVEWIEDI